MRMLLTARMDTVTANKYVEEGTMTKTLEGIVEHLHPEAAYFYPNEGDRCCMLVFDMTEPSDVPDAVEPFFLVGAKVDVKPVMNLDDLRTGLAAVGR
jgi:hypothetical protein